MGIGMGMRVWVRVLGLGDRMCVAGRRFLYKLSLFVVIVIDRGQLY